jgi:hypothetical protein
MSNNGIIYIHPGLGKTATSAIQKIAKEQLNGDMLYFPFGLKGDVHNYLADVHPAFTEEHFNEEVNKLIQLDKSKNYLISSEFLCYSTKSHIQSLCQKIIDAGFKVQVIFAVRELLPLIQSSYLQSLKSMHGLVAGESMLEFYKRNKQQFSYKMLIEKWSIIEGVKVTIIEFDKYGKGFVKRFFEYLNIEVDGAQEITNSSINVGFVELITTLDKSITNFQFEDRLELIELLIKLSDKYKGSILSENSDIDYIQNDLNSLNEIEEIKTKYQVI